MKPRKGRRSCYVIKQRKEIVLWHPAKRKDTMPSMEPHDEVQRGRSLSEELIIAKEEITGNGA